MALPKYKTTEDDVRGYSRTKNVYIAMRDGVELCADVFLPFSASKEGQKVPVICSLGPYGKDIHVSTFGLPQTDMYANMYKSITPQGPDACFELVDPILWTKEFGYALLRVDSRGIGGSQGKLDPFGIERSLQIGADAEGQDLYDIVEWAGTQPWSSGKVAFSGISYYGMVGYWAAMQKPPHLTCVMSYESGVSLYQCSRKGGIWSTNFQSHWFMNVVLPFQAGKKDGKLSEQQLAKNRVDYPSFVGGYEYPTSQLWEFFHKSRRLSDIEVPFYVAGNWTDAELHLPGNILAYNNISSTDKWLEMHTGNHLFAYYKPDHVDLQKKFLDYYLMGKTENGMPDVPRIRLQQRRGKEAFYRELETSFPPKDALDIALYLSPQQTLTNAQQKSNKIPFVYQGLENHLDFPSEDPFSEPIEILGSPYLDLEVSTDAQDMDFFVYLRAVDTNGEVIVLEGNHSEPVDSFARGYFRLSHRDEIEQGFKAQNKVASVAHLPESLVEKGKTYNIIIPFYPTAYLFEKGQRITLEIGAQNTKSTIPPMRHDGGERSTNRFAGNNTVFSHGKLILPVVKR